VAAVLLQLLLPLLQHQLVLVGAVSCAGAHNPRLQQQQLLLHLNTSASTAAKGQAGMTKHTSLVRKVYAGSIQCKRHGRLGGKAHNDDERKACAVQVAP
jgi:hypothetical protein